MTVDTERKITVTWTYAGRRRLAKGGLGSLWIDDQGEERIFKKLHAQVIGGSYEVQVSEDRSQVYTGSIRWLDDGRDTHAGEWELEDRTAYTADMAEKAERKAGGTEAMGELTLEQVRDKLFAARGAHRGALLAQILRYLRV